MCVLELSVVLLANCWPCYLFLLWFEGGSWSLNGVSCNLGPRSTLGSCVKWSWSDVYWLKCYVKVRNVKVSVGNVLARAAAAALWRSRDKVL